MKFRRHTTLLLCSLFSAASSYAEPAAQSLFDGKSLAGWEGDAALWRVKDGVISGGSLTEHVKHNDFLATEKSYADFELRLEIRLLGNGGFINSGVQIRSQRVPKSSEMEGYQCDFGDPTWWGCIYDESRRNKLMARSDMHLLEPVLRRNDWNDYVIRAEGPRIRTWINGVLAVDYVEADPKIVQKGRIGIQVHGGGKALVEARNIRITELPAPEPAPAYVAPAKPTSMRDINSGPLSAAEQLATFTLPPSFQMDLVAEEIPAQGIGKFITSTWDHAGNLWTMTATEYPVDGNENPAAADALYASKAKDKVLVYDLIERGKDGQPPRYAAQPRVFAEGLAIPLGLLPYRDGAIVQHGKQMVFLRDTDGDGKADKREILLEGLGVDDSHLFLHGLTRGPGNWIYVAQGAFNHSKIRAGDGTETKWDYCKLGRFKPDGSKFELTAAGLNNIWGFVIDRYGHLWGQEANDMGFPLTPMPVGENFPGIGNEKLKPYAPVRPKPVKDWQVGGTGLSGLAMQEDAVWPQPYCNGPEDATKAFYLANPITNRIQFTEAKPQGAGDWHFAQIQDFVRTSDPWFRPVHIAFGPDGGLYITDWYNKIISHNEVPRNHPERDKIRGRIWRVRHEKQPQHSVPNLSKLTDAALAKHAPANQWEARTAWAERQDRGLPQPQGKDWPLQDLPAKLASMPLTELAKSTPVDDGSHLAKYPRSRKRPPLQTRPQDVSTFFAQAKNAQVFPDFTAILLQGLEGITAARQLAVVLATPGRKISGEELLKLLPHANDAAVAPVVKEVLASNAGIQKLLEIVDRAPLQAARPLLVESLTKLLVTDEPLALRAIASMQVKELTAAVRELKGEATAERLKVLRSLGDTDPAAYRPWLESKDDALRTQALLGLAATPSEILPLWEKLNADLRRSSLGVLAQSKKGAEALLAGIAAQKPSLDELDGPLLEQCETVLGANSPAWQAFLTTHGNVLHPIMSFDGSEEAHSMATISLKDAFTVECWVKLQPGIDNADSILAGKNALDANFYDGRFRIWVEGSSDVAIATKPISPEAWTHVAFTRDAAGTIRIYQNGELEGTSTVKVPRAFENLQIARSGAPGGLKGHLGEFRVWDVCRSPEEIRSHFDRKMPSTPHLVLQAAEAAGTKLAKGGRWTRTLDFPTLLTEEQAKQLETKFTKFTALALQKDKANLAAGKAISAICTSCHQIGDVGSKIGPDLSGVGSMGTAAILRNILTPNAAMEAGYRVYQVRLTDGTVKEGFLASQDAGSIVFRMPGLPDERISRTQIQQARYLNRSLMPEGLLDNLPDETVRDLLAYLLSISPAKQP